MLDIAKTLSASASVHALAGSSRPGAAPTVTLGATTGGQPVCGPVGPNPVLVALVEEFEAKYAEENALRAAHKGVDCEEVPGWSALADRLNEISAAMYDVRAESMADVLLVSRFLQIRWVRDDRETAADLGHNLADDLLRICGAGSDLESVPHPDADLLALGRSWKDCVNRHDRAVEGKMAAEDRVILPAVPEVLFLDPERDPPVISAYSRIDYGTGRRWYGEASLITGLRKPWHYAFCLARRDEILAAYDAWMAEQKVAAQAAGVPAATDAAALLATEHLAIRRRILAIPAQTLDGFMLKMSVARWCLGDIGTMEVDLEGFIRSGDANEEAFALAVVLDASRVLGTDVGGSAALAGGVQPVPLDFIEFPAGRYLAGVPREEIETYRTFLDLELKYLNHEVYGRHDGKMHYWHDNPAARFLPSRSPASTRAAAVLGLLGLMPIPGVDGRAQAAASAA